MILCILRSDFSFYQTETWNQFHTPCKSVHVPIISFLTTPARTVSKYFQFYELKSVFICLLVGTSFVTSEMKYFHAYFPFRFSLFVIWLFELCLAFPQISKRSSWFEIIYPSLSIQFEDSYSTDHSVLVTARTKSVYFVDLAEERRFPLGHWVSDVERLKTPSIQIPHFNEWMLGYGLVYSWEYFPSRMAYPIYIYILLYQDMMHILSNIVYNIVYKTLFCTLTYLPNNASWRYSRPVQTELILHCGTITPNHKNKKWFINNFPSTRMFVLFPVLIYSDAITGKFLNIKDTRT